MKIALDISPLSTGHKFRGTGFYVKHLKEAFEAYYARDHKFIFFTDKKEIPKDVDIIHYPYFDPFSFSVPLFPKQKTLVTVLDLTPIIFPQAFPAGIKGNMKWQRQKFALQRVAGVITDSHSAKKDIQRIVGITSKKISVAYLAAGSEFQKQQETTHKKQIREKYNLPEKFALYVGDVTWNKNLPRLVEAIKKANVPLVMVGKALTNTNYDRKNVWNNDLVTVQKAIKNNPALCTLGFVPDEDLVAVYNSATVFVMPSLYEGFGLPILEAMACGCPVITSREGSLPEVAGDAAYFVEAYSIESIAQGLEKVFSDSVLQKNLSEKGLEQVKNFSWKKTTEETLQAYESAL